VTQFVLAISMAGTSYIFLYFLWDDDACFDGV